LEFLSNNTRCQNPLCGHDLFADARVTCAGLAALRYRCKKGAYPADLQLMDLNGFFDPFTGKTLIYCATAKLFDYFELPDLDGAGNGIRTRDFNLGKVALYH
jgi:hypothetical protein